VPAAARKASTASPSPRLRPIQGRGTLACSFAPPTSSHAAESGARTTCVNAVACGEDKGGREPGSSTVLQFPHPVPPPTRREGTLGQPLVAQSGPASSSEGGVREPSAPTRQSALSRLARSFEAPCGGSFLRCCLSPQPSPRKRSASGEREFARVAPRPRGPSVLHVHDVKEHEADRPPRSSRCLGAGGEPRGGHTIGEV
jgi:hypothetical protein